MNIGTKRKLKVMQIASHRTNIGDGANITGFQKIFKEDAHDYDVDFINEEIMEYKPHLGDKDFNSKKFIQHANDMDMVVIGGGGFFSAFERFKNTGCHVDFTLETLDQIKTPIVYYALGFAVYYGQQYHNIERLGALLDYANNNAGNVLISLRNDGSHQRLDKILNSSRIKNVSVIPDGGFYVPTIDTEHQELEKGKLNFGLQLAGDKAAMRFQEGSNLPARIARKILGSNWQIETIKEQNRVLKTLADISEWIINEHNGNLILLPHIHSDLAITDRFTHILPRDLVRFNTKIAGVYRGHDGGQKQFDLYKKLDFTMGMRFHSNVCPFGLETPSIGLVSHDQLDGLYEELGCQDYIRIQDQNFGEALKEKISYILKNNENIKLMRREKNKELRNTSKEFHQKMIDLL